MSENTEIDPPKAEASGDRVGDILRKERITRRIALETIAKDLKLNVKYIKSLEANDYSGLPADPYIRVYFRSIAKYLLLDPEEILKRFYEERGLPGGEAYKKERESKLTLTMVEKERSFKPWIIIVSAIAVLAIFSFIANKLGWVAATPTEQGSEKALDKKQLTSSDGKTINGSDSAEDSLIGALIPYNATSPAAATSPQSPVATAPIAAVVAAPTALPVKKDSFAVDPGKSLSLEIKALKDSVWVQIFSDGQSWKKYLYAKQWKKFSAKDSFNVHVGNNSLMKYTFNNKPLSVSANDVVVFKLSRTGPNPDIWNLAKWASVFKNRN